jgi:hypothetical protein
MGDDDLKVMVSSFGEQKDSADEFCDGLLGKNIDKTASSPDSAIGEGKDSGTKVDMNLDPRICNVEIRIRIPALFFHDLQGAFFWHFSVYPICQIEQILYQDK